MTFFIFGSLRHVRAEFQGRRTHLMDGKLQEALLADTVRLLDVQWLLTRPADYVLERRQALPEAAFVRRERAAELLENRRVAVLSYKWLSAPICDPGGFHMAAVRPFLRRGHRLRGLGWYRRYDALFWDYASCDQKVPSLWRDFMYQADETLSEVQLAAKEVYNNSRRQEGLEERFKKAMAVMGHFYADPFVLVLRHKALPPGHPARAYDDSGWPVFETACASLATAHGGALHDLQHGREWLRSANRRSPEEMASLIRDESRITFTGKGDRETVARMYEDFYNEVVDFDARNTPALIQGADAVVSGGRKSVALIVVFLVVLP
eukprot:7063933-Prymnesium_polylepis.1